MRKVQKENIKDLMKNIIQKNICIHYYNKVTKS